MSDTVVSEKNTKRGRPAVNITWPSAPFTVEDVFNQADNKLTKVAIQLRVKKAVECETLIVKGKEKTTGRPRILYIRAELDAAPSEAAQ